jgi:ABC-type sulfate/molybdate transport systems ATPase subunit
VVAVSHDGEFVLEAMDRAVTLEQGRVMRDGTAAAALGQHGAPVAPAWARFVDQLGAPPADWRFEPAVEFVAMRCRVAPDA